MTLNLPPPAIITAIHGTCATAVQAHAQQAHSLIPLPASVERTVGEFVLTADTTICANQAMSDVGRYLKQTLARPTGFDLIQQEGGERDRAIIIETSTESSLGKEGYRLEIRPHHVVIQASKPAGAFYACQTLRQLLPVEIMAKQPPEKEIRCIR